MRRVRAAVRRRPRCSAARACRTSCRSSRRKGSSTWPRAQAPGEEAHWHWTNESYPADAISLRSVSSDNFVIVDNTDHARVIGETDFTSAPSTLHEKAIYIVEGTLYQVERLDFDNRKAYVRQVECDYYTDAIRYDRVTILDTFDTTGRHACRRSSADRLQPCRAARLPGAPWSHGEVHVVSRVVGFKKIKFYTNENVGSGELDLPEQEMHTTGCWFTIPRARDDVAALRRRRSARRRDRRGVRDAADRAAAADVRPPRRRRVDRQRQRARRWAGARRRAARWPAWAAVGRRPGARGLRRAAHLRLRQLPGRHRPVRAAVHDARARCWRRRAT